MKKTFLTAMAVLCLSLGTALAASTTKATTTAKKEAAKPMTKEVTALQIKDLTVGRGAEATAGKRVSVHYTGTLTNGTKFDSSLDRGTPFEFTLGAGEVIQGWDKGVAGMKVGGKRHLIIPPSLGYGASPVGSIPANSTLVFDVELLGIK
jgi:peptidylprolyl isomerase